MTGEERFQANIWTYKKYPKFSPNSKILIKSDIKLYESWFQQGKSCIFAISLRNVHNEYGEWVNIKQQKTAKQSIVMVPSPLPPNTFLSFPHC